ncbi:hypothetical protein [Paraburkholderia hayleyella]|uniref:hypothetical protein n=1 Tax=Paraburkholderia hayleyella TaxID=2152889 RepID=UPI001290B14C|nr:hypothetical protein [Paraburkholderia hayleyella]
MPELDPEVADEVPWSDRIAPDDETHFVTYMRLLDAEADSADWQGIPPVLTVERGRG